MGIPMAEHRYGVGKILPGWGSPKPMTHLEKVYTREEAEAFIEKMACYKSQGILVDEYEYVLMRKPTGYWERVND